MRTGMESVYTLLDIDRGVPEVWGSKYDVRELLRACYYAIDKKPISEAQLSFAEKELLKIVLKKVKGTDIELLLKRKRAHPVELVKKVFLTSSQTRPASLGSRLRGLHPAARIISAPSAQKFHTCRASRVFPDVHAAGKNKLDFICAVRGANSARLFDILIQEKIPCIGRLSMPLVHRQPPCTLPRERLRFL